MPISNFKKVCSKCNLELEISLFNKAKTGIFGVRGDCKSCQSKTNKIYGENNAISISNKAKKYRNENKDYFINYRLLNKDKHREYINNRLKNDKVFKLKVNIRNLIRISLKRQSILKSNKTIDILGCSFEELNQYLESKFEPWMNWGNHGRYNNSPNYGWDIDHIIPLSTAKTEEDVIKLNHYSNLQPLCSYNNRVIKTNKHAIL